MTYCGHFFYYFFHVNRYWAKQALSIFTIFQLGNTFSKTTPKYIHSTCFKNNSKLYKSPLTFKTDCKAIFACSGQSINWQFCLCRQTILLVQCSLNYITILDGKYFIWNKINNFLTIRMPTWQNRDNQHISTEQFRIYFDFRTWLFVRPILFEYNLLPCAFIKKGTVKIIWFLAMA